MISKDRPHVIGICSSGIWRIPCIAALLDSSVRRVRWPALATRRGLSAVTGWGWRASSQSTRAFALRHELPFIALEDGFLRSFGTGENFPPLSMVVDDQGIYYDSTCASALEALLASDVDVREGVAADVVRARALVLAHRLSKYNHAPDWDLDELAGRGVDAEVGVVKAVLVIDQTAGDMSVSLGGASADTFAAMLAAARAENPQATIYVKTHPEVTSGRKGGYLTQVQDGVVDGQNTVVLRQAINPLSLIEQMDRVYVVTSTMGFEALLAGKSVSVFGLPWYAGWGATDDRQTCPRRLPHAGRPRSVDELFAAAYFHYTRYLNPVTHQRGTIFDVIDWLVMQRGAAFGMLRSSQ